MIKQILKVSNKWKVVIYYNVNHNLFYYIKQELKQFKIPNSIINRVELKLKYNKIKAVTINNIEQHISFVIFNTHKSKEDYINSIIHESEHVKDAILKAYNVQNYGEPPAYTIGYLASKMLKIIDDVI